MPEWEIENQERAMIVRSEEEIAGERRRARHALLMGILLGAAVIAATLSGLELMETQEEYEQVETLYWESQRGEGVAAEVVRLQTLDEGLCRTYVQERATYAERCSAVRRRFGADACTPREWIGPPQHPLIEEPIEDDANNRSPAERWCYIPS